jgi:hypothetical protein
MNQSNNQDGGEKFFLEIVFPLVIIAIVGLLWCGYTSSKHDLDRKIRDRAMQQLHERMNVE